MQMYAMYGNNMLTKRQTAVYKPESGIESQHHSELSNMAPGNMFSVPVAFSMCTFEECCGKTASVLHGVMNNVTATRENELHVEFQKRQKQKTKHSEKKQIIITFSLDFVETKELPFTKTIPGTRFSHLTQSQPIFHSALCGEISVCPYLNLLNA